LTFVVANCHFFVSFFIIFYYLVKAHEAFSTITEKLKGTDADYQQAKEKSRKAATEFQKIKKRRTKKFLDAFNHIDTALKTIYTDMTKSSKQ
jgi:structural maintenance of chromosome 1